jgi:hypothetical protein
MMLEFANNRTEWLRASRSRQCNLVLEVTHKHLANLQRERGVFAGREPRSLAMRAVQANERCSRVSLMSMWRPASLLAADLPLQWSPDDGEPVTGAYEPYLSAIESVINSASSPAQTVSAIDAVLASAAGIPDPDLQVVYAAASLAVESAAFWYDYEAGGGWSGSTPLETDHAVSPMSIFTLAPMQAKSWKKALEVDVVSCYIGVADKVWLSAGGPVGWKALAGACALFGGGGSLIYGIS